MGRTSKDKRISTGGGPRTKQIILKTPDQKQVSETHNLNGVYAGSKIKITNNGIEGTTKNMNHKI